MLLYLIGVGGQWGVAVATAAPIHSDDRKRRLQVHDPPVFGPEAPVIAEPMQQQQGRSRAVDLIGNTDSVTGRCKHGPHGTAPVCAPKWPLSSAPEYRHNAAQQPLCCRPPSSTLSSGRKWRRKLCSTASRDVIRRAPSNTTPHGVMQRTPSRTTYPGVIQSPPSSIT